MKKLSLLSIFLITITSLYSTSIYAQNLDSYGDMKRPANIGVADFDNFKNACFDIYFNSHKLDKNLQDIETNLTKYAADKDNIDFNSLREDIKSLNAIGKSSKELTAQLKTLDDKSESMVKNAKNIKPKTKAPKAVKNTNNAIKALNDAKSTLKTVGENQVTLLKQATELLGDN